MIDPELDAQRQRTKAMAFALREAADRLFWIGDEVRDYDDLRRGAAIIHTTLALAWYEHYGFHTPREREDNLVIVEVSHE